MRPLIARVASSVVLAMAVSSIGDAQATTTRESVDSTGTQGNGSSGYSVKTSADGRYVAFGSYASNLVPGDTNGTADGFVRDRQLGTTERVNVDSNGAQANAAIELSYPLSISADGRCVAFSTAASNLVPGDTNATEDVFLRDRQAGTTERVNVDSGGMQADMWTDSPALSANGRYVAFSTGSTNLVVGDTNATGDVFIRDRQAGTTQRVSVGPGGIQGNLASGYASLSADGRYVAFGSYATNFVVGDTNGTWDIFVRDVQTGAIERVSISTSGAQINAQAFSSSISADGRYVVFCSAATTLVPGDTNSVSDVFLRDRQAGTTERVSVSADGVQANNDCIAPSISAGGRYVAFVSTASNLVPGDVNGLYDVFIRDRSHGTTELANLSFAGAQGNGSASGDPEISSDGRYLAFGSLASNLVTGDTNGVSDVFVRDRGLLFPGTYCTAGVTTNGCVPVIRSVGTPSASSGSGFRLDVRHVEGQRSGMLFYGLDNSNFAPSVWGASTSYLCVKSPMERIGTLFSGGAASTCDGALSIDWNAFIATNPSALGNPFAAGQHIFAQGWFRDPPSPKTTMLSNGIEFIVGP